MINRLKLYKDEWGVRIRHHAQFHDISQIMIDRQKTVHDSGIGILKKYLFTKPMSQSTINSYKSKVAKIIYSLIYDNVLTERNFVTLDIIIRNLQHKIHAMQNDIFIDNLIRSSNICRKSLICTVDFYCNAMDLSRNEFVIPKCLKTPKDLLNNREQKNRRNTVVDDIANKLYDYIVNSIVPDIRTNNRFTNKSVIRGSVLFMIIVATGLRITEAFKMTLEDLKEIEKNGQAKVHIHLKKKDSDFAFIKLMPGREKYLSTSIEILQNYPNLFAKISSDSSTKFNDLQNLVKAANLQSGVQIQSNMFRHMLASQMFNEAVPLTTISEYMNHNAVNSTRNYINRKYHRGPMKMLNKT
ncbi:very late factor 1 [Neodiprion abietis nucleopolyhedrovirus]|uniref:Very late factor 1 n=1 Tax=Neodiprion abietis nucleopolyhedrovirus TaxID=204507 RepID=Q0ZP35_9CBAC|nr:very late factor 1 [Neodiprion abietis nucleopolyhedrovirus]ABC74918.1 very late factor 1 [Neodiprion abietis nucleopolyhedrovirus]